ncbi:MAG: hypothetical protein V9F00_02580 [Nocardioides sp.]
MSGSRAALPIVALSVGAVVIALVFYVAPARLAQQRGLVGARPHRPARRPADLSPSPRME